MRKYLIGLLGYSLLTSAAMAQGVNTVPQVGLNFANLRVNTYSAAILKLVPAASGTDFFCINGSSTKKVHINQIVLSGTATTLITTPIYLNHNLGLDTGTRAVAATYGPVPYPLNSVSPAASASTIAYNSTGGNPSIGGTVTTIRSGDITFPISGTSAVESDRLVWNFGTAQDAYNQRLDIPAGATTEQYCLNLTGTSPAGGVLQGYIEWTEE